MIAGRPDLEMTAKNLLHAMLHDDFTIDEDHLRRRERRRHKRTSVFTLSTPSLALLAACGGGGTSPAPPPPPPPSVTGQVDTASSTAGSGAANGNVLTNDVAANTTAALTVSAVSIQNGAAGAVGQPLTGTLGTLTLSENGSFTFSVADNATVRALPVGRTATEVFLYTPVAGATAGSVQTLTVTVQGINDAPVVGQAIGNRVIAESSNSTFQIDAAAFTDVDSDATLTLSARLTAGGALPGWLTFDAATRTFSARPGASDSGAYSLTVVATDQAGASAQQSFTVQVDNAIAGVVSDLYSVNVLIDLNNNRRADANEPGVVSDPSGRFVLVTTATGPLIATSGRYIGTDFFNAITLTAPTGSTVINPLTTIMQTLITRGLSAAAAESAVETAFSISPALDLRNLDLRGAANGDSAALAAQKASIAIGNLLTETRDAAGALARTFEDAVLDTIASRVSATATAMSLTDASSILTLLPVSNSELGSPGIFSRDAAAALATTVAQSDQRIFAATTVQEIVSAQQAADRNTSPTATADAVQTMRNAPIAFDVRTNDTDADGNALSVVAIDGRFLSAGQSVSVQSQTSTLAGSVTLGADGRLTYNPETNFTGTASFRYTVSDGQSGATNATATVSVTAPQSGMLFGSEEAVSMVDTGADSTGVHHLIAFDAHQILFGADSDILNLTDSTVVQPHITLVSPISVAEFHG